MKENQVNKDLLTVNSPKLSKQSEENFPDLSFGGKIFLSDYHMCLNSNYNLYKNPSTNLVQSSSEIHFEHQICSCLKYSLKHSKNIFKFCSSMSLLKNFLLTLSFSIDNTEKISSFPFSILSQYTFKNNNFAIKLGIKDFNPMKEKYPSIIQFGCNKPFNLWGNNKIFINIDKEFNLIEKFLKSRIYKINYNNLLINSLLTLSFIKKNANSICNKVLNFKAEINASEKFKVGTDVNYNNEDNKGIKLVLFSKYIMDPFTKIETKWDDNRSISFNVLHDFRGLIKFGVLNKISLVDSSSSIDKKEERNFFRIPSFKNKVGIKVEIIESL